MEGPRRGFGFGPSVALSADLRTLAQGLDDGTVRLRNTETGDITNLKAADSHIDLIALSPDGRILITGGHDQNLRWWDLRHHTNTVLATEAYRVLFSPDGRTLAAFQRGDAIQLWDVATLSLRTNLVSDAQPGPGSEAAFSLDGRILAVASSDDAIHLLDVATGKLLGTCTGHKQPVFSVAFSPDGRTLATASDDSTLKFWNVATQQELLSLRRLGGALRGLMFSTDGRLLVGSSLSSLSGGLRFYRAPLLSETDAANAQTSRKTEHP
jgi:WD40 repeat protein